VRIALRLGLVLLAACAAFAAITWLALEQSGVAVIETHAPDGTLRATHVWTVERDGALWLEAGSPTNAWFADLTRDPHLRLRMDGATRDAVAEIVPEKSAEIRAALHAKYGWRDAWIQMLVNANRSTAVRLTFPPS
jgi:hypothetical protein